AAGIELVLNGVTVVTDENGLATFFDLEDGTYTIEVNFGNNLNEVLDAIGGLLNVTNVTFDSTSITFDYNITGDVAQDGVLHDHANDGSSDLNVSVLDAFDDGGVGTF